MSKLKTKKLLIWISGGLVTVVALAWLALVIFFPAEKMRLMLEERASVELERPVAIGSVRVSVWGGFGALVSDISVGNTAEAEGLNAKVESVDIKVRFWPLFQGEYVVDRLIIERPEIQIRSGAYLSGGVGSDGAGSQEGVLETDVAGAKLALGGLGFGKLEIRDGSLVRIDSRSGATLSVTGIAFEGNLTELSGENLYQSEGAVEFEAISYLASQPGAPLTIPAISIEYQASVDSALSNISLKSASVSLGEGQFSISGEIPLADGGESTGLLKIVGEAPLAEIARIAPNSSSTKFTGKVELDLEIGGSLTNMEKMSPTGRLAIVEGAVSSAGLVEQLESLNAEFQIHPSRIEITTLDLAFSESDLALSGVITNPFPYLLPVSQHIREKSVGPYLQFSIESKRLNMDKLFPEAAPGSGVNRALAPPDSTPPFFLPEMKGSGTVNIDTLIYAEMEFAQVESNVSLERRRIFCNSVKGRVMDGEFEGEMLLDLTNVERPEYSGSFVAQYLNVTEFINRFTLWDGSGLLSGEMSANVSYLASGWRKEEFIAGLTMDIFSTADSLQLTSVSLSDALTSSIQRVSGASLMKDQYQTFDLRSFKSKLRFIDGQLQVDTLRGFSDALGRWEMSGTVDMAGGLSLSGLLVPTNDIIRALTPKNSLAGAVAGLLRTAPEGAISIPFTMAGTTAKPKFALDADALSKALNKTLKEQGGSILEGIFKKR
jgi:AsmA-like C-terminal region/AsmA family